MVQIKTVALLFAVDEIDYIRLIAYDGLKAILVEHDLIVVSPPSNRVERRFGQLEEGALDLLALFIRLELIEVDFGKVIFAIDSLFSQADALALVEIKKGIGELFLVV